ncbi:MAG: hypothetical protein FJY47_01155, partial [Betaproteobacteria bacterium]|nr:hypothetical protein [Betaproteobacteria bacterium]
MSRWIQAVAAAGLIAAPPAFGQAPEPNQAPPQSSAPSAPMRFLEGIGNAIQSILRSIFGGGEGEIGTPSPAQPQQEPRQQAP